MKAVYGANVSFSAEEMQKMLSRYSNIPKLSVRYEQQRDIFSPTTLDEYIGQEHTKKLLRIFIEAAQKENRPLPNLMFVGGYGLGKTSLAKVVAKEFGKEYSIIDGSSVEKGITGLTIIDEIHNMDSQTCDALNLRLDENSLHLMGCTTNHGMLPAPFRSRFRVFTLHNYAPNELAQIGKNICQRKGVTATDENLLYIAERSRTNARQIITYLATIFDLMAVQSIREVIRPVIDEIFALWGVDDNGYLERDRKYVNALPERPVGLGWLSAVLGIDPLTIQEEVEPFLLQTGVIDRTSRGRIRLRNI